MKNALLLIFLLGEAGIAACGRTPRQAIGVGDFAPNFSLVGSNGETIGLGSLVADGPVLLYFNMGFG